MFLLAQNEGYICKEEFIAYYDDCNINFPETEAFIRYVSNMWSFKPEISKAVKEEEVKAAIKGLRFKLIQKSQGTDD